MEISSQGGRWTAGRSARKKVFRVSWHSENARLETPEHPFGADKQGRIRREALAGEGSKLFLLGNRREIRI
jgi:hypothetical protein